MEKKLERLLEENKTLREENEKLKEKVDNLEKEIIHHEYYKRFKTM